MTSVLSTISSNSVQLTSLPLDGDTLNKGFFNEEEEELTYDEMCSPLFSRIYAHLAKTPEEYISHHIPSDDDVPKTFRQAWENSDLEMRKKWRVSIKEELQSMISNKVWEALD
jgi:hypothetical protein